MDDDIALLGDPGHGLNAALASALAAATSAQVDRVVFLAADLPLLHRADVVNLLGLDRGVVIATDSAGQGTNALSLPVPTARDFAFHYGPGSARRHRAMARALDLGLRTTRARGLAFDVDDADDLARLRSYDRILRPARTLA